MAVFAVIIAQVSETQSPSLSHWHFIEPALTLFLLPPLDNGLFSWYQSSTFSMNCDYGSYFFFLFHMQDPRSQCGS